MSDKLHVYESDAIQVTWDKERCIHFAACVRGMPRVFDPGSRPWVILANGPADRVASTVEQCPTGALHYQRKDGGAPEAPDGENSLRVSRNGPLYIRGQLELTEPDGSVRLETRLALCRCGASAHKPLCDGSHTRVGFHDEGVSVPDAHLQTRPTEVSGPVRIEPLPDGPMLLRGSVRVLDATGTEAGTATRAAFCRCGQSGTKPFCDGSHARTGFTSAS